jgi:hypothetical protein
VPEAGQFAASGWNPNVFFQVGAACSFSGVREHDRGIDIDRDQVSIPAWCALASQRPGVFAAAARALRTARSAGARPPPVF